MVQSRSFVTQWLTREFQTGLESPGHESMYLNTYFVPASPPVEYRVVEWRLRKVLPTDYEPGHSVSHEPSVMMYWIPGLITCWIAPFKSTDSKVNMYSIIERCLNQFKSCIYSLPCCKDTYPLRTVMSIQNHSHKTFTLYTILVNTLRSFLGPLNSYNRCNPCFPNLHIHSPRNRHLHMHCKANKISRN